MKQPRRLPSVNRLIAALTVIWHSRTRHLGRQAAGLILTFVLLPGVIYLLAEALRKPSTFHIAADTEILDMVTTGVSATRWYIEQGDVMQGAADPLGESPIESYVRCRSRCRSMSLGG